MSILKGPNSDSPLAAGEFAKKNDIKEKNTPKKMNLLIMNPAYSLSLKIGQSGRLGPFRLYFEIFRSE
jgi:hypothetical protein